MMSIVHNTRIVSVVCCLSLATRLGAATYYVDFEGGDDSADGLSPETAWQHSPGDSMATATPKAAKLAGGDTVVFKGGVSYRGSLDITMSGEPGKPVVFDGNSAGDFGKGSATLEGGKVITGWQRCASADEVNGNPLWKDIFYADIDVPLPPTDLEIPHPAARKNRGMGPLPWQRIVLADKTQLLPVAQDPNPKDPFWDTNKKDYYKVDNQVQLNVPLKMYYEEGSQGNPALPLRYITRVRDNIVIQPLNGGAVSFEFPDPVSIASIGVVMRHIRDKNVDYVPDSIVFLADGHEVTEIKPEGKGWGIHQKTQRFALPKPITARKITYKLRKSGDNIPAYSYSIIHFAAFTPDDRDLLACEITSSLKDEARFVSEDPKHYEGMSLAVIAGNNMAMHSLVRGYDPKRHEITFGEILAPGLWKTSFYAFYNSPRIMDKVGEWCAKRLSQDKTRIYLLSDGHSPKDISYPELSTGIRIDKGVSHISIKGFVIQNYSSSSSARDGGVSCGKDSKNIAVKKCEIRHISGFAAIGGDNSAGLVVENCQIHDCKGWTVGIFLNRVNDYRIANCHIEKTSGNGIRTLQSKNGIIQDNRIKDCHGQHAGGMSLYQGSANVIVQRNHVSNSNISLTINRNAENIVIRNNVFDASGNSELCVGLWNSGNTDGTKLKNLQFLNNTFVNTDHDVLWSCGILGQHRGAPSRPQVVIKNNILDRLLEDLDGPIENNIFTRPVEGRFMGTGCSVVTNLTELFVDPANGDYRLKPGSPAIDAGADLAPPPIKTAAQEEKEKLKGALDAVLEGGSDDARTVLGVAVGKPVITVTKDLPPEAYTFSDDLEGTHRPQGQAFDIGAYEYKE